MSPKLPENKWKAYKATIWSLYIGQDRQVEGPGGVIEKMEKDHNFCATKAMYVSHFKRWNFRKNIKSEEWEAIVRTVSKRRLENRESHVIFNGKVVSVEALNKELHRRGYKLRFPYLDIASTPRPPETLSIPMRTPPPQTLEFAWPSSLPWFQFEETYLHNWFASNSSLSIVFDEKQTIIEKALSRLLDYQISTGAITGPSALRKRASEYFLPEAFAGQRLTGADPKRGYRRPDAAHELFKICVLTLSNNLMNISEYQNMIFSPILTFLMKWAHNPRWVIDEASSEFTLKALLEKVFEWACNDEDLKLMEMCIDMGISPNHTVSYGQHSHTFKKPIQIAALTKDIPMAKLLIDRGADVNGTARQKTQNALSYAFWSRNEAMINLVLESGGNPNQLFDSKDWEQLGFWESPEPALPDPQTPFVYLITFCIRRFKRSHKSWFHIFRRTLEKSRTFQSELPHKEHIDRLILAAVINSDCEIILGMILQTLLDLGGDINTEIFHGVLPVTLSPFTACIETCLSLGASPGPMGESRYYSTRPAPLHRATLHGDLSKTKTLISKGADVNHRLFLEPEDLNINCQGLGLEQHTTWLSVEDQRFLLSRYSTPLQFTLAHSALQFCLHQRFYESRKVEIARYLLSQGAKLIGGEMPDAVELGDLELVKLLYETYNASLDDEHAFGWTPVQGAIRKKSLLIARFLIDSGARLEGREMYDAIYAKCPEEFIEYLGNHESASGNKGITELFGSGDTDIISRAVSFMPSRYDSKALCCAVTGFQETTEKARFTQLVRDHLIPNTSTRFSIRKNTAIAMAACNGSTNILDLLLGKSTQPQSQLCYLPFASVEKLLRKADSPWRWIESNWLSALVKIKKPLKSSPVAAAMVSRDEEIVPKLLDHGFNPDGIAFMVAIVLNKVEMLHGLLKRNVNPNQRFSKFDTALQIAVSLQRQHVIEELLKWGADINADPPPSPCRMDSQPRTALQHAVGSGDMRLAHRLIEMGACVNAPAAFDSGATALQIAAAKGSLGLAKLLISKGADPNAKGATISGRTALEIAAEYGRIDMLQFLLDGNPSAGIDGDYAPKYISAEHNGHRAAAELLTKARDWSKQDHKLYDQWQVPIDKVIDWKRWEEDLGDIVGNGHDSTNDFSGADECSDTDTEVPEDTYSDTDEVGTELCEPPSINDQADFIRGEDCADGEDAFEISELWHPDCWDDILDWQKTWLGESAE